MKENVNQGILNPNFFKVNTFTPYISSTKPLVNDNKEEPSKPKKFSGKYNYNPPKSDGTAQWDPYTPGWENENNNNNNNNNIINKDRNENNNNSI
jgi:hypothetical protein